MFVHLKSINEIKFIAATSIDKLYYLGEWLKKSHEFSVNFQYLNELDICLTKIGELANLDFSLIELPVPEQKQVIEAIIKVNFDDFAQKKESTESDSPENKNRIIEADKYLSDRLIRLMAMNLCSNIDQAYKFASSIPCSDLENILHDQYEYLTANQKEKDNNGIDPEEVKEFTQEILDGKFFGRSQQSQKQTKKAFLASMGVNLDEAQRNSAKLKQQSTIKDIMADESVPLEIREQLVRDFKDQLS